MKVGIFLAISIFLWSLYPLFSVWALEVIDPFTMMLIVQFLAFHGALFFSLVALFKRKQIKTYVQVQKKIGTDGFLILMIAGACSAFSHIFFLIALTMANKNGITLIIEIWPILAVFFAPQFIIKNWEKTTWKDYMVGVVAFFGIALIVLSDPKIDWFRQENWEMETLLAYGMALLACYMTAILNLLRAQYAQKLHPLKNSFAAVMIAEGWVRFIAVVFILIAVFGMQMELENPMPVLGLVTVIGVGIFVLGGAALSYALMRAENPNVSLFFYMVPLLSVIWLILLGVTEFTTEVMIGGIITTGACLYLGYEKRASKRRFAAADQSL